MEAIAPEKGFPCPFISYAWELELGVLSSPGLPKIKIFYLVDSPHGAMGTTMISFPVHVIGLQVSFFGRFKFPLVLWPHLPIFLRLVIDVSVEIS